MPLHSTHASTGRRRISPKDKTRAVLRVLQGEDGRTVARDLDVPPERIEDWKSRFMEAGQIAMEKYKPGFWQRLTRGKPELLPWIFVIVLLFGIVFLLTRLFGGGGGSAAP